MVKAIVYTSNTGNTERYAEMLGYEVGLPVFSLSEAKDAVEKGTEIIYVGWVMANGIRKHKIVGKLWDIRMVCAVGMGETGSNVKEIREKNNIPVSVELFTLQGGFCVEKLHGVHKLLMRMMVSTAGKALAEKADRTKAEDDMLDLMTNGGSRVSLKNLEEPIKWCTRLYNEKSV